MSRYNCPCCQKRVNDFVVFCPQCRTQLKKLTEITFSTEELTKIYTQNIKGISVNLMTLYQKNNQNLMKTTKALEKLTGIDSHRAKTYIYQFYFDCIEYTIMAYIYKEKES